MADIINDQSIDVTPLPFRKVSVELTPEQLNLLGHKKIEVYPDQRIVFHKENMSEDMVATLENLKVCLDEEQMVKSMFGALNGASLDVYKMIRRDYQEVFYRCNEVKKKVSAYILDLFESTTTDLGWTFSAIEETIIVYTI